MRGPIFAPVNAAELDVCGGAAWRVAHPLAESAAIIVKERTNAAFCEVRSDMLHPLSARHDPSACDRSTHSRGAFGIFAIAARHFASFSFSHASRSIVMSSVVAV